MNWDKRLQEIRRDNTYDYKENIQKLIDRYEYKIKWLRRNDENDYSREGSIKAFETAIYDLKDMLDKIEM